MKVCDFQRKFVSEKVTFIKEKSGIIGGKTIYFFRWEAMRKIIGCGYLGTEGLDV